MAARKVPWFIILAAPAWGALVWNIAYGMVRPNAVQRGYGDTGYAWLPLLTVPPGLIWILVTIVLLVAVAMRRDKENTGLALGAAATNVVAVLVIFGSMAFTGSDGWPTDAGSRTVLAVAAVISLVPAVALVRWTRGG